MLFRLQYLQMPNLYQQYLQDFDAVLLNLSQIKHQNHEDS